MKKLLICLVPLIATSFLFGCNNGDNPDPDPDPEPTNTHLVILSQYASKNLKFTNADGSEITLARSDTVVDRKDYVFNIEALNAEDTIYDWGVFIYVGDTEITSFDFKASVNHKSAIVTIPGDYITDDVTISALEKKEGYFICDIPFLLDTKVYESSVHVYKPSGEEDKLILGQEGAWYGYVPEGDKICIDFYYEDESSVPKTAENIVLYSEKNGLVRADKAVELGCAEYAPIEFVITLGARLTVYSTTDTGKDIIGNYLHIAARGEGSSLLDFVSWETINDLAVNGYAKEFFELGETKTILINGHNHLVKILAFGANDITFQFATAISDTNGNAYTTSWGDDRTENNYHFTESSLNYMLNNNEGKFYKLLPDDLKNVLKQVTKKVGYVEETDRFGNVTYIAKEYTASLFPLAVVEITDYNFGDIVKDEGELYSYYVGSQSHKSKRIVTDANGKQVAYFTRTPSTKDNDGVYYVSVSGQVTLDSTSGITSPYAIAPAFVVGKSS